MIYLASPYSHKDPAVVKARFLAVEKVSALLMLRDYAIFSPIMHCHVMATKYEMPTDAKYWQNYNTAFIRKADAMFVLTIDGWEESLGVTQEIGLAEELNLPVQYFTEMGLEHLGFRK